MLKGRGVTMTGTSSEIAAVLPKITKGARWNTQEAWREITISLRNSFRSSA